MEWELLDIDIQTEVRKSFRKRSKSTEIRNLKRFGLSRLRVIVEDHLGVQISPKSATSMPRLLDRAVENAKHGPRVRFRFNSGVEMPASTTPPTKRQESFEWFDQKWPGVIEIQKNRIRFQLRTGSGQDYSGENVRETMTMGISHCSSISPVVRLDSHNDIADPLEVIRTAAIIEDDIRPESKWLFNPTALSKIFLDEWYKFLVSDKAHPIIWPPGIFIKDRGLGTSIDLEGTLRRPVEFVHCGQNITKAYDLHSADTVGCKSTGHGGIWGRTIDDLIVGSEAPSLTSKQNSANPGPFVVIIGAHMFQSDGNCDKIVALTQMKPLREDGQEPLVVDRIARIRSGNQLFKDISWCGPVQAGISPWVSRWAVLDDPTASIELLG